MKLLDSDEIRYLDSGRRGRTSQGSCYETNKTLKMDTDRRSLLRAEQEASNPRRHSIILPSEPDKEEVQVLSRSSAGVTLR